MHIALNRLRFAVKYAILHLFISSSVALVAAGLVYGLWYPSPYGEMLGVSSIFFLILAVDVVCGPLLTFVLSSPKKPNRERLLDFSVVGAIQIAALAYGMHSVWVARPAVLVFETDRLVVVTANEIERDELTQAPEGYQALPLFGLVKMGTRHVKPEEVMSSLDLEMSGISSAMRPSRWVLWDQQLADIRARAKPLTELIARRPGAASKLRSVAAGAGFDTADLSYLPLTSSKVKEWVALLDKDLKLVGYAPVDGF